MTSPGMTSTDPTPGFRERVLALVARIPEGRVMTYGQLALLAGNPGAARQAGFVLNSLMGGSDLPWQRVINAQGRVSTHKVGFGDMQERLLMAEGVAFEHGRCDLSRVQWWPDEERAAPPAPLL
ncbi:MGMT family protein [Deinococcus kurensis]|uniref:MGMT family protein n=1 Tax=Deinococcus kurensis TaxID=2662757 RepID=UPI0012D312EC|nr:MGMT family protein [Deinococcus kurensis]